MTRCANKDGQQLGVVGRWWGGQHHRGLCGIDGLFLIVVSGDGTLVVPVDVAMRRPDPKGPGAPCRDTRSWARTMSDARLEALRRRGLALPAPVIGADRWFGDSKRLSHVRQQHQGTLLVEGKRSSTFPLCDGRQVKGEHVLQDAV